MHYALCSLTSLRLKRNWNVKMYILLSFVDIIINVQFPVYNTETCIYKTATITVFTCIMFVSTVWYTQVWQRFGNIIMSLQKFVDINTKFVFEDTWNKFKITSICQGQCSFSVLRLENVVQEAVISSFGQHKQCRKFSKPSLQVVLYPRASTSTPSRKYVHHRRQRLSALIASLRGHPLFTTRKLPGAG